jgi:hypothetical protein
VRAGKEIMEVKTYTAEDLQKIQELHGKWRRGEQGGVRASLVGANLDGATLPTGETWELYLKEVVPALLVAGGRTIEEIVAEGAWDCHSWTNCPMAAAFRVQAENETPLLLRPRVRQFVHFFDAKLIPKPVLAENQATSEASKPN